jgi:hypothetical protein
MASKIAALETRRHPDCASSSTIQMIEAFAPNRADEPLDEAVLTRRARCGRVISDPHCTNAAYISRTECAVAIANQMTRRFVPRKGVEA